SGRGRCDSAGAGRRSGVAARPFTRRPRAPREGARQGRRNRSHASATVAAAVQWAPMNIVVTVKQVPDPNTPPKLFTIDEGAKRVLAPTGIPPVMNGYDANALEEAVRLKEQRGAKVTAVSVGGDEARDALRRSISLGAIAAIQVEGAADLDSA